MFGDPVESLLVSVSALLLAYLLGSIPAGVLVARRFDVDIQRVGSGNTGATNVQRALGWGPALVTAAFDLSKGAIAVVVSRWLGQDPWLVAACGVAAVIGHTFSVFLGFTGGKGAATALGTILAIWPVTGIALLPIALSVMAVTRYVSAGVLVAGVAAPVLALTLVRPVHEVLAGLALGGLMFFTHRSNLTRLWTGSERRVGQRLRVLQRLAKGAEASRPQPQRTR